MQYAGASVSTRQWLLADERGSIVAVTDWSGAAIQINSYDEYGAPAPGNAGRFGYTGQVWLPETGLYHYKNRAYNPELGRFMQTDPIGVSGGMNLYAYVGGDPVNFVDPLGLEPNDSDDGGAEHEDWTGQCYRLIQIGNTLICDRLIVTSVGYVPNGFGNLVGRNAFPAGPGGPGEALPCPVTGEGDGAGEPSFARSAPPGASRVASGVVGEGSDRHLVGWNNGPYEMHAKMSNFGVWFDSFALPVGNIAFFVHTFRDMESAIDFASGRDEMSMRLQDRLSNLDTLDSDVFPKREGFTQGTGLGWSSQTHVPANSGYQVISVYPTLNTAPGTEYVICR